MITLLRDRPEIRRFVEYLFSPEGAAELATAPYVEGLLPVRAVDSSLFPDEVRKMESDLFWNALDAGMFRVGASDLMPPQVGSEAFPESLNAYLTWGEHRPLRHLFEVDEAWP